MDCKQKFKSIYKRDPSSFTFCPYRICPVGAHVDHQHGKVLGITLDKGVTFVYTPKQNGVVEMSSVNFDKRAQYHVNNVPEVKQNDWADHLRGATIALGKRYHLKIGVAGVFSGDLPIGGLSSSASVIISFLLALCKVNEIVLTDGELVDISREAENYYVGVSCGILDQSCEVLCKKNHLLYLDTQNRDYENIPHNKNMLPYEILILFSGKERSLKSTNFNLRVDECKVGAFMLKAYEKIDYNKFSDNFLREIPYETFIKYKQLLPEPIKNRLTHFYEECNRVDSAVKYWREGDVVNFGKVIFESGKSSIQNYQTGSPELVLLYNLLSKTDGVYGARFSGAGFQGCCFAIVDPNKTSQIIKTVSKKYLKEFPELKDKFITQICHSSDGVSLT